ncbi:MAG: metalloregulator ArsR/SmtB family transcription factor [Thermomicrobiales bacterium]
MTVNEIVEATDLSQSNTSNHLACLFECGLVRREQRGKFVVYSLIDHRVAELLELAERVLADIGQGIYDCTRYPEPERSDG